MTLFKNGPSIPLTYYTAEPTSAEGKIRNRSTGCKPFSGRVSQLVTGLLAIVDPSVAKSYRTVPTVAVDEKEEGSKAEGENGADDFFFKTESSDHGADGCHRSLVRSTQKTMTPPLKRLQRQTTQVSSSSPGRAQRWTLTLRDIQVPGRN